MQGEGGISGPKGERGPKGSLGGKGRTGKPGPLVRLSNNKSSLTSQCFEGRSRSNWIQRRSWYHWGQ